MMQTKTKNPLRQKFTSIIGLVLGLFFILEYQLQLVDIQKGTKIPLRQKIWIGLTSIIGLVFGLLFVLQFQFKIIEIEDLYLYIWIYPTLVSFWLLAGLGVVDLDNKRVYSIWFVIGIIHFIIYLFGNILSFKTLLIFLLIYKLLNFIKKRFWGDFLLDTFMAKSWKHDETKKRITWFDVISNMILFALIIISSFTK